MKKTNVLFLALILLLSACTSSIEKKKIGVIIPLTGPVATYGQDLKKGIEIAFENEGEFKIYYEDDKAKANEGLAAMKKLRDINGVDYFIGCATTTVSLALAEETKKKESLLMVPIATGDDLSKANDNVFMISPKNEKQAIAAYNYIKNKLNKKRIGVLFQQNSYGTGLSSKFIEEMQKNSQEPLFSKSYIDAKKQIRTILADVKETNPEVIFIPAEYEPTATILKVAKELGMEDCIFIGTDGAYSSKLFELAADATSNFYLTMFPLNEKGEMYTSFLAKYKEKNNGDEPNVFTCYGYETAMILKEQLKNNASFDEVILSIGKSKVKTLSGETVFDKNGDIDKSYAIYKVMNDNFEILE